MQIPSKGFDVACSGSGRPLADSSAELCSLAQSCLGQLPLLGGASWSCRSALATFACAGAITARVDGPWCRERQPSVSDPGGSDIRMLAGVNRSPERR